MCVCVCVTGYSLFFLFLSLFSAVVDSSVAAMALLSVTRAFVLLRHLSVPVPFPHLWCFKTRETRAGER